MRTFLWILAGFGLGVIVHLIVILSLPSLAQTNIWTQIQTLNSEEKIVILDDISSNSKNPMQLDPEILYGVCQLDLSKGVGVISARLPDSFWSVSVFDSLGRAVYGTTNRSSVGQVLQLGIFNFAQTKLLANQQLDVIEGLLIVEAQQDDLFVVFRLAPPHQVMRGRYREILSQIDCSYSSQ